MIQINTNTWYFKTKEEWDEHTKWDNVEGEPKSFPVIATHAGSHWNSDDKDSEYWGFFYLEDLMKVLYPQK